MGRTTFNHRARSSCAIGALVLWSQAHGQAEFHGIGDLPGGARSSVAKAISRNGQIVVGHAESSSGTTAIRWSVTSSIASLGDLPGGGYSSSATCTDSNGAFVAGSSLSTWGREAFVWSESDGLTAIGGLASVPVYTVPYAIADGAVRIVGTGQSNSIFGAQFHSVEYRPGQGWREFGDSNAAPSYFACISTTGNLAYINSDHLAPLGHWHLFKTNFTYPLTFISGGNPFYEATACDATAEYVVGVESVANSPNTSGAVRRGGAWTKFNSEIGASHSSATAVTDYATTAFGSSSDGYSSHAVFWRSNLWVSDLRDHLIANGVPNVAGWQLTNVAGVSSDGKYVAGNGINPAGQQEGWWACVPDRFLNPASELTWDQCLFFGGSYASILWHDSEYAYFLVHDEAATPIVEIRCACGPIDGYTPRSASAVAIGFLTNPSCTLSLQILGNNWVTMRSIAPQFEFELFGTAEGQTFFNGVNQSIRTRLLIIPYQDIEASDGWLIGIDLFRASVG